MSLVVTVYVPSGIVMAADSRMSGQRTEEGEVEGKKVRTSHQFALSDNAYKIVELATAGAGVSIYDAAVIADEPADSHVRKFEEEMLAAGDDVQTVADKFLGYFRTNFPNLGVGYHVAGYKVEGKLSVPYVLAGHTVREPHRRVNANAQGAILYGVTWAGDSLVVSRMIDQKHLPLFGAMPLQDAIDYAVHLIRTTIDMLRFEPRYPSVGGPIDVLVVKPDGMQWVQQKQLLGER